MSPFWTVPIIAVSAYVGDKAWCDRAKAAGCNECVGKPVDFDALERLLGDTIERSRGRLLAVLDASPPD